MGIGLIRGAWNLKQKRKSQKDDVIVTKERTPKMKSKKIKEMKKRLDEMYDKYKEKAKNIPDWAKRTDPTLVGIEIQISDLQDKIAKEEEKIGDVI